MVRESAAGLDRNARASGSPGIARLSRTFRLASSPSISFRVRAAVRRLSRLSSRSRYSRQRSLRYRNPISSRPRFGFKPRHLRPSSSPPQTWASESQPCVRRDTCPRGVRSSNADPIINRFHCEARTIRGLGNFEIVARLGIGGNLNIRHLRSPPDLVCHRHSATPLPHSNGATQ
jgi:hypothetical protein